MQCDSARRISHTLVARARSCPLCASPDNTVSDALLSGADSFSKFDFGAELRRISSYAFQGGWGEGVVALADKLKYRGAGELSTSAKGAFHR